MGRLPPADPAQKKGRLRRASERIGQTRAYGWLFTNVGRRIDPTLMRLTRGRVNLAPGAPIALLTHTGARSGKQRQTPLTYFTDGDDVVLIGSRAGDTRNPAWFHNVTANPEVELWARGRGGRYRARVAEGSEHERLWELATTLYSGFDTYQGRAAGRQIPVVVFSPHDP
jgi:deazaflavin-dependent oxidoreductase (nitroreductase family)